MHIGLVTASYLPVINGVTRMVSLYKKHLEAAGHRVTVFTFGESRAGDEYPGIVRSPGLHIRNSGYYFSLRYSARAQELLAQVDIIHCHHLVMGLEFAHRYGRSPIVFTSHTRYDLYVQSYLHLPGPIARGLMGMLWPRMIGYCDIVVAPSESMLRLLRNYGITQPIEIIANGIETEHYLEPVDHLNLDRLGLPKNSKLMVYVGRLAPEKNLEKLLHEFSVAVLEVPRLYLLVVGSGPSESDLMQLVTKLNIDNHVIFCGAVSDSEVPRYLAVADTFVTSSQSEVLPLSIIEAMAAGLPVVAIESPGIHDLIQHGETGLLSGNREGDLARDLVFLANDYHQRNRLGKNALAASQRYHIQRTVADTILIYERLLKDHDRPKNRPV